MNVVATAGHVDHGKSTLVQTLTGIDPDRWAEEKRRGLTIDLGFAWAVSPQGDEIGFVDVPGHERFLANMLAGVGSVPAALLVIDVQEGWRAQTIEHATILDLLEVRAVVVAITKIERVDRALRETRIEHTRQRLASTGFADAPIVPVSARTGEGLGALWEALGATLRTVPPRTGGCARMWIDRAFSIRGAGTVVTGTLTDGTLAVDAPLRLLPEEHAGRARALHRHGEAVRCIEPLSRAAVNVAGLDAGDGARGMLLTTDPATRATTMFDAELTIAAGAERVEGRSDHRVHVGTSEVGARLTLLEPIAPGARGVVRLRLDAPLPVRAGDRCIVRDTGRRLIVAGGRILDPSPRGSIAERGEAVRALAAAEDLVGALVDDRGCLPVAELAALAGSDAIEGRGIVLDDQRVSPAWFETSRDRLLAQLAAFHDEAPVAAGLPSEDARGTIGLPERAFRAFLAAVPEIVDDGVTIRLAHHVPDEEGTRALRAAIAATGMHAADRRALEAEHGRDAIATLMRSGGAVALGDRLLLEAGVHEAAMRTVLTLLDQGPQTTSALREALGTSRKVALPFLEALDRAGITRFDGTLRRRGPNAGGPSAPDLSAPISAG